MVLNTIAVMARSFDSKIVKNIGDGLVCYFCESNSTDEGLYISKNIVEAHGVTVWARTIPSMLPKERAYILVYLLRRIYIT
jgi:hypothetical protein